MTGSGRKTRPAWSGRPGMGVSKTWGSLLALCGLIGLPDAR